jgi:hypothetical protein
VKEPKIDSEEKPWSFLHDLKDENKLETVLESSAEANMTSKITPDYHKEPSVDEMLFDGALAMLSMELTKNEQPKFTPKKPQVDEESRRRS